MSEFQNPAGAPVNLKQKLLEALSSELLQASTAVRTAARGPIHELKPQDRTLESGRSIYSLLDIDEEDAPLTLELTESKTRLQTELLVVEESAQGIQAENKQKKDFDDTLTMRGVVPNVQTGRPRPVGSPPSSSKKSSVNKLESVISGGSMADLSGYKDLSKAPMSFGDDDAPMSTLAPDVGFERSVHLPSPQAFVAQELPAQEVDTEFSGNVKTLIRLVNELPEGVTKQTGAQIIRLTMEAMGISMEDVLSEAQSAQSEMLDAVRANIKKIEEYKTVIRKLETDIKYYQGKANELSEIIDLFILSNTTGSKSPDDLSH